MRSPWFVVACALVSSCTSSDGGPTAPPPTPPPVVDADGRVPNLRCPGDPGCATAEGEVRAGVGLRSITPAVEPFDDTNGNGRWDEGEPFGDTNGNGLWDAVWIAGFSNGRAATGVHDDVWARALVLDQGELRVGLVALDLIGFFHDDVVRLRLAAAEAGLELDHVLVATTHGHEGPDTMGIWGPSAGQSGYDAAYVREVVIARSVEALADAAATLRPARARSVVTEAPELVNDTRLPEVIDQALSVLQLRDAETDAPIATTVVWGNHPEALGSDNTLITSDFAHYLRDELEARYGAPAVYFNGSLGGLSTTIGVLACPDEQGVDQCPQGTFERAERIGRRAATRAIEAIESSAARELGGDELGLGLVRRSMLLGTTNDAFALAYLIGLLDRALYWFDSGKQLSESETAGLNIASLVDQRVGFQSEVGLIRIGPWAILNVPAELYPELWLARPDGGSYAERPEGADFRDAEIDPPLQSLMPPGVVPVIVNNANDALGYVLPKTQWDVAAPYAYGRTDSPQYGEQNSLGPDTARRLFEEIAALFE